MAKYKRYVFTSTRATSINFGRVVAYLKGLSVTKPHVSLIVWSLYPLLQSLWASNSAKWWFMVKGSHPTVTWPLINLPLDAMWQIRTATYQLLQELLRVLIKGDGLPPIKSNDLFLMWSDEVTWQIKIFISPFPPKVCPPNFQGSRFRMRGSQLPSHITT